MLRRTFIMVDTMLPPHNIYRGVRAAVAPALEENAMHMQIGFGGRSVLEELGRLVSWRSQCSRRAP